MEYSLKVTNLTTVAAASLGKMLLLSNVDIITHLSCYNKRTTVSVLEYQHHHQGKSTENDVKMFVDVRSCH